jgi:replicative DNA helicase
MNQQLPYSETSEVAVLGSMILKPSLIYSVSEQLVGEDFYLEKHSLIFDALLEMSNNDDSINLITLTEQLKKSGNLKTVGDRVYLAKVLKDTSTSVDVENYIKIVLENSIRRKTINLNQSSISSSYNLTKDVFDTLSELNNNIEDIENKINSKSFETNNEKLILKTVDYNRKIINGEIERLDSPLIDLNRIMNFERGEMMVLGGRPSMGKTALALTLSEYWSKTRKTAFISFEMSSEALTNRRLSFYSGYTKKDLTTDIDKLNESYELLIKNETGNLIIDDRKDYHYNNIRGRFKRLVKEHKADIIIVDYLQLIPSIGNDKRTEVGKLSNLLKKIALELNIRMVVLAQLNRISANGGLKHESYFPKPHHLKEAGETEQDADHILLIHRPEKYMETDITIENRQEPVENLGILFYEKQRNGDTGSIILTFEGKKMKYSNFASYHDEKVYKEIRKENKF